MFQNELLFLTNYIFFVVERNKTTLRICVCDLNTSCLFKLECVKNLLMLETNLQISRKNREDNLIDHISKIV